jgi:hypothetical protein
MLESSRTVTGVVVRDAWEGSMKIREGEFLPFAVLVLGFALVAAWFALLVLEDRPVEHVARAPGSSCGICGVVERVAEVDPAPRQPLEGSRAEGTVILLAALGGATSSARRPARIYETSVVHDDGTVRVLQDWGAPHWKAGDRVKVIKGRVIAGKEEPAAAPEGRK